MSASALSEPGVVRAGQHQSLSLFTLLLWIQGLYYLMTGVWPLVSIETFQTVTGRKTDHIVTGREADHWLVQDGGRRGGS